MKKNIFIICLFLFIALPLAAEVKLYMMPRIFPGSSEIMVEDIARIEGDSRVVGKLRGIIIDKRFYQDGFIDRSELLSIIKEKSNAIIFIYGSAARVVKKNTGYSSRSPGKNMVSDISVKNGDRIRVVVSNNGIKVEISGTASGSGSFGDEIQVMLKNRRKIKGKISGRRLVEVNL